jgi:ABC-2 type transport system ATP-binding protein
MSTTNPALELRGLTKRYGRTLALDHIDLTAPAGTALALLGRNGAGKSTLLSVILGLMPATSGQALIFGKPIVGMREADKARIGYVADGQDMPAWMTLAQYLAFLRPLYPGWDDVFCKRLLGIFDLPLDRKLRQLSRGQRAKAAFLGALAHHPRLLLLDEPFGGLDPAVREELLDALFDLMNREEWTIVVSSHEIDEVERLADRVAILDGGRIVLDEEKDALLARCRAVSLLTEQGPAGRELPAHWWHTHHGEGRVTFIDSAHDPARFDADLRRCFADARHVQIEPVPLKSIFRAHLRQPHLP